MSGIPFFPIFPICFQCGTDQNPCHCKVVGPTLGKPTPLQSKRPILMVSLIRLLLYHRRGCTYIGYLPNSVAELMAD
jgi:hypothetical protein